MNVHEFAATHNMTTAQVTRWCRASRLKSRRIGFGALAYWEVIELWEDFAPLDVTLTSKGVGGWWTITVRQDEDGFALTAHHEHTGERTRTVRFATGDDAAYEYRRHEFDPTRVAAPELLP